MKKLLATLSDDNVYEYTKYTLPIFKYYADKWEADFKILDDLSYNRLGHGMWNYRTMVFHELLNIYDQIIYMDSDIVINKTCPDLYNIVPFDTIGLVLEDKGSRRKNRLERIKIVCDNLDPNIKWTEDYLNGGFYIVSNMHKNIFTKINESLWPEKGFDCNHYMFNIIKYKYKYIDLGYKFNHMSMFSEEWNQSKNRLDSYIIHYAGGGRFPDKGDKKWIELLYEDIKTIYGDQF